MFVRYCCDKVVKRITPVVTYVGRQRGKERHRGNLVMQGDGVKNSEQITEGSCSTQ